MVKRKIPLTEQHKLNYTDNDRDTRKKFSHNAASAGILLHRNHQKLKGRNLKEDFICFLYI